MENLNKQNFWNELHEKYPLAVDHFCKWIDKYKEEVNWEHLFKANYTMEGMQWRGVKFHDLPFEMQNGIICRYTLEVHNSTYGKDIQTENQRFVDDFKATITDLFIARQHGMDKRSKHYN